MTKRQRPWAIGLAIAAVLALAFPSATAVYEWLLPVRGPEAAFSAAAGIELTYLSLACLFFFTDRLKQMALRLQLWAVFTAVLLNSVESYSKRQGVDITTGAKAWATFDVWLIIISVGESIPLAGLAFGVSMILHNLVVPSAESIGRPNPILQWWRETRENVGVWWSGRPKRRPAGKTVNFPLPPVAPPPVPIPAPPPSRSIPAQIVPIEIVPDVTQEPDQTSKVPEPIDTSKLSGTLVESLISPPVKPENNSTNGHRPKARIIR